MAVFDQCGSIKVCDVDTITSRLVFPKTTVGYYATRYMGAEVIMAAVPETT
jgi:hypothetical protein